MLLPIREVTLLFIDSDCREDESAENDCYEPPDCLYDGRTSPLRLAMGSCVQPLETCIAKRGFLTLESLVLIRHLLEILR